MNASTASCSVGARRPATANARPVRARVARVLALRLLGAFGAASLGSAAEAPTGNSVADLSLAELLEVRIEKVLSASKYEQRVTRAPAAVTIVTADEIESYGHRTLADVLKSVRGLQISDDRNVSYLGVRGFSRPGDYNTRMLVLLDGHRMNDNVYDAGSFGRETMLDMGLVDRVEVVRGPSSSIYGSSAFLGVVNVVTKRGAQLEGGLLTAEAGTNHTYQGRLAVGRTFRNGADWVFSASDYRSDGEERIYYPEMDERISSGFQAANQGVAERSDGEHALNVFSRLAWKGLTFSAYHNVRSKLVPTASFGSAFNDGREEITEERTFVDVSLDRGFGTDGRLLGRIYYDNYRYRGDYPFEFATAGEPSDIQLNYDGALGEWTGTEWQVHLLAKEKHRIVLGVEGRANLHQDQYNYYLGPRYDTVASHRSSRTAAAYAQAEFALTAATTLNAGLRHDYYFSGFGGTTNPRLGLIHEISPRTTIKLLYGEAFRAPNVYEQQYLSAQRGAPSLGPEKVQTYELVWEQYLGHAYQLSLSAYRYHVDALIEQSTLPMTGDFVFQNIDSATATGGEVEFEGRWDSGWSARVSYARQRAIDDRTGLELTNSPRDLAKLNVLVPLAAGRLSAGLEVQYRGSVITLGGSRTRNDTLTNLTLSTSASRAWSLSASVYNLFDRAYHVPGASDHAQDQLPQPRRSFRLKATHRF